MNIGRVFAIAEHIDLLPAEPHRMLIMSCCVGVPIFEFIIILRVAEYDGTDCQLMRQNLTWKAIAHTSMVLLMGFDTHARPDRGTVFETLIAQYAIIWWFGGGTVMQTPGPEYFDWTFVPRGVDYILWRQYNQWAPSSSVPTRWEHKSPHRPTTLLSTPTRVYSTHTCM
jgi:hypothetical protein